MPSSDEFGPLPTSSVRAQSFDEAGWAVRTLADNAQVGRRNLGAAIAVCVAAMFVLGVLQPVGFDVAAVPLVVLLMVLLGLIFAFILQGAEPVFRRIRLGRQRLVIDEVRGDWTLDEDELLVVEGANAWTIDYDDVVHVDYADPVLTIGRRGDAPWELDWLSPGMADEVVTHLQRVLARRRDDTVAARERAAIQQLVTRRTPER